MARILITSGPTRQYLDPVRYLTNASSGRMGAALAQAALGLGHEVVLVSGPVNVSYPSAARLIPVLTTDQLLEECQREFPSCDGVIGAAAPCDYKVERVSDRKLAKTGDDLLLRLVETPDVIASLGQQKKAGQWAVGFALETHDAHFRAVGKMQAKCCDLMVVNGAEAMESESNEVTILDPGGEELLNFRGNKEQVGQQILSVIEQRLLN